MRSREILDYENRITDRTRFNESFLGESPQHLEPAEYFDNMLFSINDLIGNGAEVITLPPYNGYTFRKITLSSSAYYWLEKNDHIWIAVELSTKDYTYQVRLLGKKGKGSPYAVDLYLAILSDGPGSLTLMSDTQLTNAGIAIWKRLFHAGHTVTVYDRNNPGESYMTIRSIADLENYFGDEPKYQDYRYVLTEQRYLAETRSFFNTRRIRERNHMALEDQ